MSYPYPELVPQLQFLTNPSEYRRVSQDKQYENNSEFWKIVPKCTFARCPLCGMEYRESANVYEFKGWGYTGLGKNLYASDAQRRKTEEQKHCVHFVGVRTFINLHNIPPNEVESFDNREGEVPLVDAHFFLSDLRTYAVLHALPVCRIEDDTFVPSYTVFIMSYFSEKPSAVIQHTYDSQSSYYDIDPDYYPTVVQRPDTAGEDKFDLSQWVERGQLGWLDFTSPSLPLRIGSNEQLPSIYRVIEGKRKAYVWVNPEFLANLKKERAAKSTDQ